MYGNVSMLAMSYVLQFKSKTNETQEDGTFLWILHCVFHSLKRQNWSRWVIIKTLGDHQDLIASHYLTLLDGYLLGFAKNFCFRIENRELKINILFSSRISVFILDSPGLPQLVYIPAWLSPKKITPSIPVAFA